jgi:hypothetical protein
MDEVTQQNAALVEQAAAAAESLEEQAQNLAQAVAVFNTGTAAAQIVASAAAPMSQEPEEAEQPAQRRGERRGPNRAANVARLPAQPAVAQGRASRAKLAAAAGAGGNEEWAEF